jgi:hypothetical protein
LITKHGVWIEVLLNAPTRQDEQGKVISVAGISQNISGCMAQKREYSKLINLVNVLSLVLSHKGVSMYGT